MLLIVLYLQIAFALSNISILFAQDILVTLPDGTIRGRTTLTYQEQIPFYYFQKIPFAAPPLGNLRFKAPIPPASWEGILNATDSSFQCYQVTSESDSETEDCLYVNVYTPQLPNGEDITLLPVMFYIYGGGFFQGSAPTGAHFLIEQNVVVVTTFYRLGPFGFLSTEDTVIPGNNGLKDQQLAIKWTKNNIALFGGDPEKITIFGQSAGATSATYQLLNPESEGLFRGVIGESGSFLTPWGFQRRAREIAFQTAGYIDETFNDSDDSEALLEFLLNVDAEVLDDASLKVYQTENLQNRQLSQGFFYGPVIEPEHEEAFFTEKMYGSLQAGNIVKVPLFIGINSEESIGDSNNLDGLTNTMRAFDDNLDWLVPDDMRIDDLERRKQVGQQIRQVYVGDSTFQENLGDGIRYLSDTSFTRSIIMHADLQSQFTDVYFYKFSYDGLLGNNNASIEGAEHVGHSEDVFYIWAAGFNNDLSKFPENDQLTQKRIITLWTNFAKTLNPTPEISDLLQNIVWPKVSDGGRGSFLYVDIDTDLSIKDHPKDSFIRWNEIYANLGYDDFDTY